MKFRVQVMTGGLIAAVVLAAGFSGFPAQAGSPVPDRLLEEARRLAALEEDYFQKRKNHDWKALYALQHPTFQKHVTFEEYLFHEGRVVFDYRDDPEHHLSGGLTPSLGFIRSAPPKKDALGFPQERTYRWFVNPHVTIEDYRLDRISISADGNYAMVALTLLGKERLPPSMVRGNIEFDTKRRHVDYWEKIDGQWRIALLANPAKISGGSKVWYFIPNDNSAWETRSYYEVDPERLASRPEK